MEYTEAAISSEKNILEVRVVNSVVHQKDVQQIRQAIEALEGDCYSVLCDLTEVSRIPSEIRNMAWKTNKNCVAKAVVVNSFLKEMLIKSYLLMTSSDYPVRIFFDKQEAKHWLKINHKQAKKQVNIRNVISML